MYITQAVVSEFLFYFLALKAEKKPWSAKQSDKITEAFGKFNPMDMLPGFIHLNHSHEISVSAYEMIKRYNSLPNDAIIIATCIHNDIKNLASYDSDFKIVSNSSGIKLISSLDDINKTPRINPRP